MDASDRPGILAGLFRGAAGRSRLSRREQRPSALVGQRQQEFGGRGTDFGYSCSPTIEDGKVLLPVGGRGASVVALSVEDGSTLWQSGDEPASYCSALPITFEGRRYVIGFLQNALAMFDLHPLRDFLWSAAAFSLFFWSVGGWFLWRAATL